MDPIGTVTSALTVCNFVLDVLSQIKSNAAQRDRLHLRLARIAEVFRSWEARLRSEQLDPVEVESVCGRIADIQIWLSKVKTELQTLQAGGLKGYFKAGLHRDAVKAKLEELNDDLDRQISLLTLENTLQTLCGSPAAPPRSIITEWHDKARGLQEDLDQWVRSHASREDAYIKFRMSPKGPGSSTHELDGKRKSLKAFWDEVAEYIRDRSLTAGDSDWLQHAHSYRLIVEPMDIANYYRLKLWACSGGSHYLEDNNRPTGYQILQAKWEEKYQQAAESSTDWAAREQQAVQGALASVVQLHDLAAAGSAASHKDLNLAAQNALLSVQNCRLPKTRHLLVNVIDQHWPASGAPAGSFNQNQLAADAGKVLAKLKEQECEN